VKFVIKGFEQGGKLICFYSNSLGSKLVIYLGDIVNNNNNNLIFTQCKYFNFLHRLFQNILMAKKVLGIPKCNKF